MSIRKLSDKDVPFLVSAKDFGFSDSWTEEMYLSALSTGRFDGLILSNSQKEVAFITFDKAIDTADIEEVFVLPEFRKSGIGFELVNSALTTLREEGINKVFLEVRESNIPAINLYLKCGFEKINVRKKYYSNGENAIIFVKEI